MLKDRELGKIFGSVSKLYDSARIGYPKALINDIVSLSKISVNSRILEIGCGSGKATKMLGEKGLEVLALDLSEELIEVSKKNTSHLQNVKYKITSFENANLNPESFDLIVAAQSWHWMNSETRYKIAHEILKDSGFLAIFWKYQDADKSKFVENGRGLFRKHCPKFPDDFEKRKNHFVQTTKSSNLFNEIQERTYNVNMEFSKEKYIALLQTISYVAELSDKNKKKFLKDVSGLLEREKDPLLIPYKYELILAKRI